VTKETLDSTIAELRDKVKEAESREIVLGAERSIIRTLCQALHDDPVLQFNYLSDITAVDWAEREPRFEIVYRMYCLNDNRRLWIKVPLEGSDPSIESVCDIWRNANWMERELWDMFGIKVKGHPDLRRLLMPSMYIGHPLRKDFPIGGEEIQFSINEDNIVRQELYLNQSFEGMDFKGFIDKADEVESYYGASHLVQAAEQGKLVVSMGPQHPSTHGVLRVVLALDGEQVDDAVLDAMGDCGKVCKYIDLPLQHASASVLKRMKRPETGTAYTRLLDRIRRRLPGMTLRTTFIVGFPGESEAEFADLEAFVHDQAFDHVGVFTYSHEEGTTAHAMTDDVPVRVKRARQRAVMEAQRAIVARRNRGRVGQRVTVVVDGPASEHELVLKGRTEGQAPDIDSVVYLSDCDPSALPAGAFIDVEIVGSRGYDLVARPFHPAP
jgi:NADH/F420H2 dehydrogenase subunit C